MVYDFFKTEYWKRLRSLFRAAVFGLPIVLFVIGYWARAGLSSESVSSYSAIGNYLAGQHAQSEGDFDAAINFLAATVQASPEATDLLKQTFILMIIEGRLSEALPYGEKLVADDPNATVAHLVTLVAAFKDRDKARQVARLEAQPNNGLSGFSKPILEAWSQVGAGEVNTALQTLGALNRKEVSQGLHDFHKALILDFAGHTTKAELAYRKLISNNEKQNFRLIQLLGNFWERNGKKSEARQLYDKFAKANPGTMLLSSAYDRLGSGKKPKPIIMTSTDGVAEALFNIGHSLSEQHARETALVFCRLALWLKPNFPIAQMMLAEFLDGNNRYEKANQIYSDIEMDSPFRFSADLRRANNLNFLNQLEAAIKLLDRMAKEFTSKPEPLIRLGNLMRRHERWDEAIVSYTEAIERVGTLSKRHWRMLYSRGIVLERAKRWPEAEKDFLQALEFEPDQPLVLNYLGYSWVDQGVHLNRALKMIHEAVRRRPNDGYIIDSLGWVYFRLGNFKKAVLELERAVQIRPDDPIINDHLGDAYWRVGRELEAKFQWKRALGLKPDSGVELEVIRKLKEGLIPIKNIENPSTGGEKTDSPSKT